MLSCTMPRTEYPREARVLRRSSRCIEALSRTSGVTDDFTNAEGDILANRWTSRATHSGELMGIAATGKDFESSGMTAVRIAGGKVVELWNESDQLVLMQQLGVIPPPGG